MPTSGAGRTRGSGHTMLVALRMGVTLVASIGGAAVYLALSNMGMNNILAVLLGLGFALISRQAASSLVVDAVVRRARQTRAIGANPTGTEGTARPTTPRR